MKSSHGYHDDDDDDDDRYSVQLEGSEVTPRAAKVIFIIISKQISD